METPENLVSTPVGDIKKQVLKRTVEGELVKLPSGIVVRLIRPNISYLLRTQKIPVDLMQVLIKQAEGKSAQTYDEMVKNADAIDAILLEAFVEPKLVKENPTENELCVTDLEDADRGMAFLYVQSGVQSASSFR